MKNKHCFKKRYVIAFSLLLLMLSCNTAPLKTNKKTLLTDALYKTPCFSHKQAWKDSVENINRFLIPHTVFTDSINNVTFEYYTQTADFCLVDRFILVIVDDRHYIIPWCMAKYCTNTDTTLFQSNNETINSINEVFKKEAIHNKNRFLKIVFENLLHSEIITEELNEMIRFKNANDSIAVSRFLQEDKRTSYDSRDCSNIIWSYKINKDTVDITLVNRKMGMCFSL